MAKKKSRGQLAYETYATAINWTQYVNDPREYGRVIPVGLTPWREVPPDRKAAWEKVADILRETDEPKAPTL